jgi:hypothetical protein
MRDVELWRSSTEPSARGSASGATVWRLRMSERATMRLKRPAAGDESAARM